MYMLNSRPLRMNHLQNTFDKCVAHITFTLTLHGE